jgi:hypothetical protein
MLLSWDCHRRRSFGNRNDGIFDLHGRIAAVLDLVLFDGGIH